MYHLYKMATLLSEMLIEITMDRPVEPPMDVLLTQGGHGRLDVLLFYLERYCLQHVLIRRELTDD